MASKLKKMPFFQKKIKILETEDITKTKTAIVKDVPWFQMRTTKLDNSGKNI